ncbi:hypothetical protein HBJ58_19985 [Halomonas desiderata]|uniref:hypothetical protein n=1 Tax=Billgrantia desiderata TaxID=52021 RepID=UPI00174E98BB|nr:hypothetical protein [Halomonas desiderata]
MRPTRAQIIYLTVILLILAAAIAFSVWIYQARQGVDLVSFTVSMVSFGISMLALFIALQTYISIDSVNKISRMDGNILDNEYYVTSVPELLKRFNAHEERSLQDALFSSIERKLKRESATAVDFADTLQYMVDLIVLFPAAFSAAAIDPQQYQARMNALLTMADRRKAVLHSVNKGAAIQINEVVKLFKGVVTYQRLVAEGDFKVHGELLDVRGPILRNPVTRTVYHNYLGLFYNKKGMHRIREGLQLGEKDLLSLDGVEALSRRGCELAPDCREEVIMHLRAALGQFDKALEASGEDDMWLGFIRYNQARTLFVLGRFVDVDAWQPVMEEAIRARNQLNHLIGEVLGRAGPEATHLQAFFLYQEELARLMKLNFLMGVAPAGQQIVYRGHDVLALTADELEELLRPCPRFPQVPRYQQALLARLAR